MLRKTLTLSGAAVIVALGGGVAVADDTLDCSDFETPIIISEGYDPFDLDRDGDGVGCEGNPGEPVRTDLYADLSGGASSQSPKPELAQTGWGPGEHPVRWMGAAGVALVGGAGLVLAARKGVKI